MLNEQDIQLWKQDVLLNRQKIWYKALRYSKKAVLLRGLKIDVWTRIKKLINMDTAIKMAFGKYGKATSDKEVLRYYQMREQALSDYNSGMARQWEKGKLEGRAEGKLEGKLEEKIESILSAHKIGISVADIARFSRLSEAEVFKVLNEN